MLTSSYVKTVNHAISNSFNSFSRISGQSITYTGEERLIFKKTIPSGSNFFVSNIVFNEDYDYLTAFSSNGKLQISGNGVLANQTWLLDSGNNYVLIFANQVSSLESSINKYSSDSRYSYTNFNGIDFKNTGNSSVIITLEKLSLAI